MFGYWNFVIGDYLDIGAWDLVIMGWLSGLFSNTYSLAFSSRQTKGIVI
jgi:hypothetical protein